MKKPFILIMLFLICISFSGCWDYQSIAELNIISGIAVDTSDSNNYLLTFEIVNVSNGPEGIAKSIYADAEGSTLFETVRNAKKKLANKFYLGNMQLLVISEKIAQTQGILSILDALLRDGEPRETVSVVISREKTAQAILKEEGLDITNVAYELHNIIEDDEKTTTATKNVQLFHAYNALNEPGMTLVLPTIQFADNGQDESSDESEKDKSEEEGSEKKSSEDKKIIELSGIAFLPKDRLAGYLSAAETHYFLTATNNIVGGAFSLSLKPDEPNDISMEIKRSVTKPEFSYQNDRLKIKLTIKNKMNLIELREPLDVLDKNSREELINRCQDELKAHVTAIIKKAQEEFKTDIFSYGNRLYKNNPRLWEQVKDDWSNTFCNAEIEVLVQTDLVNTGIILGGNAD